MKIKLPLRVVEAPDRYECTLPFVICDGDGDIFSRFQDQQTAQLFADCFEVVAIGPFYRSSIYTPEQVELAKRAAEAVEE